MTISAIQPGTTIQLPQTESYLTQLCDKIKAILYRFFDFIRDCFCCCPREIAPIVSTEAPWDYERLEREEEQAAETWQAQMQAPFTSVDVLDVVTFQAPRHHVNLTSTTESAVNRRCEPIDLECIPHIWRYGHQAQLANNWFLVKLPVQQLRAFPDAIRQQFSNYPISNVDVYFMVQSDRVIHGENRRNILFHSMAFPDIQEGEARGRDEGNRYIPYQMGVFDMQNASRETLQPAQGMPENQFGPQYLYLHPVRRGAMGISPDHSRIRVDQNADYSSFYSACELPGNRACAFFTILLHNEDSEQQIRQALIGGNTEDFAQHFEEGSFDPELVQKVQNLLTFQRVHTQGPFDPAPSL